MQRMYAFVLVALLVVAPPGSRADEGGPVTNSGRPLPERLPAAAAAPIVGPQAGGGPTVLYYADYFLGADPVLPALQAKGFSVTQPGSWAEFRQALNANEYDLAVALNQNYGFDDPAATAAALSAHLATGRAAWLVDWTLQASVAAPFQGGYAGPDNQQPVSISDADLAAGVTNPLPLTNPGWGRWSWGLSPSGAAAALASFPDGSPAVVLGNGGHSALIGFTADCVTGEDGQRFFENLLDITVNAPPAIQGFQPTSCAAAAGTPVTTTVAATDADGNLVAESLSWGDGTAPDSAAFDPTDARNTTFSHTYAASGLYRIAASAADASGATASRDAACLMAVFDPADSVKGSGSFDSPAGAYKLNASFAGKATFAIRAKYAKGASKPKGSVKFNLPIAKLKFKSSSLEWLVLSGASNTTLKGAGTINKAGSYGVLVAVTDGGAPAGGGDKIRVKIVNTASGATVYDNQLAGDTADEAPPTAAIASGSIIVKNVIAGHRRALSR